MASDNTNLYVIYDTLADRVGPVFEAVNDEVAVRSFKSSLEAQKGLYMTDYKLLRMGYVDRDSQCIISETTIDLTEKTKE